MSKIPWELYRGVVVSYDDFINKIKLYGVDLVPPFKRINEDGKAVVHDGNEYGLYMSDNIQLTLEAYGNPDSQSRPTYLLPYSFYQYDRGSISLPSVGIVYKIDTNGLTLKHPELYVDFGGGDKGNNGYIGEEWITQVVPASNYKIERLQIGSDYLHNTQNIIENGQIQDITKVKEKTIEILNERKSRLEFFAEKVKKMTPVELWGLNNRQSLFRDIYGENGVHYLKERDIDYSTTKGYIDYLLFKAYNESPEKLDYKKLDYIESLKRNIKSETTLNELISIIEQDGKISPIIQGNEEQVQQNNISTSREQSSNIPNPESTDEIAIDTEKVEKINKDKKEFNIDDPSTWTKEDWEAGFEPSSKDYEEIKQEKEFNIDDPSTWTEEDWEAGFEPSSKDYEEIKQEKEFNIDDPSTWTEEDWEAGFEPSSKDYEEKPRLNLNEVSAELNEMSEAIREFERQQILENIQREMEQTEDAENIHRGRMM